MEMRYISKETIDNYAKIKSDIFGDIILQTMGYKVDCQMFCKCKSDNNAYKKYRLEIVYIFYSACSIENYMS